MEIARIVIKIGSNVLTRPDGMLDITRMSAIVDQVAELRQAGKEVILVSSGAVASGRGELRDMPGATKLDALSARQLFSAVGQAKLINRYYELFREHGIHCGQVLATKENFACRGHYLNQQHCMAAMLAHGVIPIVNENDTVSVTELMFTDNDELSGLIATMMNADRLIILSNIDGLYTGDPADPASELIPRVEPGQDPSDFIAASKSTHGRGGMVSKCRISRRVAAEGIEVIVANGKREHVIPALVGLGASPVPHTVFVASPKAASGVKKWIAHSDAFAKGNLCINRGAAEAIARGASLLAVGITSVDGDFDSDDIVTVAVENGPVIAWGKCSFGSAEARGLIGRPGERPVIHADYLFVDPTFSGID